jgi:hypothetical protein
MRQPMNSIATKRNLLARALLALAFLALAPAALRAQPCFDSTCCLSPSAAPEPCAALGGNCYGVEGRCFSLQATWWDPSVQPGLGAEMGIHLRWAFNLVPPLNAGADHPDGITFPKGGFEIQRRLHGTTWWEKNFPRIYPATGATIAIARIPSSLQTTDPEAYAAYTGDLDCDSRQDLQDLIEILRRVYCPGQGYRIFWYLEGSKNTDGSQKLWDVPFPPPQDDYRHDEYAAHLDSFFAANRRYPSSYEFMPLEFLHLASSDPVIARILGLYYVDSTAIATERYDYRVIAHYVDLRPGVHLCYSAEVDDVGAGTVQGLPSPDPIGLSLIPLVQEKASDLAPSEMAVGVTWINFLKDVLGKPNPDAPLVEADGITPLSYLIWREDLGETGGFRRLKRPARVCGETVSVRVPPVLIGGMPDPVGGEDAPPLWKEPPFFRDSTVLIGHRYRYQVRGMDIFGRYSPPGESGEIKVEDLVPPPAPIIEEAAIFQTADPEVQRLPEMHPVKKAGGSIVLHLSWLWPDSFREPTGRDDLKEFKVVLGDNGFVVGTVPDSPDKAERVPFPGTPPSGVPSYRACDDGKDNDGDGLIDYPEDPDCEDAADDNEGVPACSDGIDNDRDGHIDAEDDGCSSANDTNEDDAMADRFEVSINLDSFSWVSEPNSESDPVTGKVRFYDVWVRAFDMAMPEGNWSQSRAWKTAVRDIDPPDAPMSPYLLAGPEPPDPEGRAAIALGWAAEENLTYFLYRADDRAICESMESPPADCTAVSPITLHDEAAKHPKIFRRVTPSPVGPFEDPPGPGLGVGSLVDRVPGLKTPRSYYFYVLRAVDPAGNVSDPSPVSEAILVPDGLPPAKPVIARAYSPAVGQILVEWLPNQEPDVVIYRLYSTDVPWYRFSKRKMTLLQTEDVRIPDDTTINGVGRYEVIHTPARPENLQYYRLEAEDDSGNISTLSEAAAARTVDHEPPGAPAWINGPLWACPDGIPQVQIIWTTPPDASEFRLLRREGLPEDAWGAWQDLTGWLGPGHNFHQDLSAFPERSYQYRVEARDASGNVSPSLEQKLAPVSDLCGVPPVPFRRGDANDDGTFDISDAVFILGFLFMGSEGPSCEKAADTNDDGAMDISDGVFLLAYLFLGAKAPNEPLKMCGLDPTGDNLSCQAFVRCP